MAISKSDFSDLTDEEIDNYVGKIVLEFPNCGETLLRQEYIIYLILIIPKINEKLQLWREAWVGHRLRTAHNSPRALWIAGQFQSPVGISESELLVYGAEGLVDTTEPDVSGQGRPIINGIGNINQDCLNYLHDIIPNDWVSNNHGVDIYIHARNIIRDHNGI